VRETVIDYFDLLGSLPLRAEVTDGKGTSVLLEDFYERAGEMLAQLRQGNKLMFVGNGGSASIASHIAVDFNKNVGIPTMSFNDGMMLSALANDEGVDQIFARQVGFFGELGDLLIAISSSGNSQNIVNAVEAARAVGCRVITMSGFKPDNRLRQMGDFNLYVPSGEYGFVEISHLALVHALVDFAMGWTLEDGVWGGTEARTIKGKLGLAE
jgi:D-sedoheptulose 7-phosphate isomerase